jgi:hypothetical protein
MRRSAAMLGIFVVIALALLLLYKVWVHHNEMELYEPDGSVVEVVGVAVPGERGSAGKIYPAQPVSHSPVETH